MKIGVLIPTRGDRKNFLIHALKLISNQTQQPDEIFIVDEKPKSNEIDITYRYRVGCEKLFKKGCDVILFWEDDDWYHENYIEIMIKNWLFFGEPDLFGLGSTTYYHIGVNKYRTMIHKGRSSAFTTMVTKEIMNINFGKDSERFFDIHLWKQSLRKETFLYPENICLGIKHGVGSCGGKAHLNDFPYDKEDADLSFLKLIVDEDSFKFYTSL